MKETQYISSDFLTPRDAWDKLSIEEQAAMMKAAISEGILDLGAIRQKYNEFAEGGNTDDDLVDWIIREEGFLASPQDIGDGKMTLGSGLTAQKWHDLYKRNGNKWTSSDNRRAVREEVANRRRWAEKNIPNWDSLPSSSQKALLSYKYNYDFNQANSPKLFKALADSNLQEAARQMDATSSNPAFKKGLQDRRQREQEWFLRDVVSSQPTDIAYQPAVSTQVYNPYVQQVEATRMLPINEPDPNSYIRTREVSPQEQRRRKFQENVEAYQRFNALMNLIDLRNNPAPSYSPIYSLFGDNTEDFAKGGKIHIDPSKKGTFTAAASKHGMGVQQFASKVLAHPENYSPAMRKRANFAKNAAKWKHGDGGNIYGGGGFASLIAAPALPDVEEIRRKLYNGVNPAGYQHIPKRIWEALNGKEANKSIYRDDQWATYLQIPEEERHHGVEKLKPARYKPSKGAPEGDVYRVSLNNEDTDTLIKSVQLSGLNIGENTVDRSLDKYFGDHTIGRGHDENGEYVSYYDKYDLNPFAGGTPVKTGIKSVDKWLKDTTSNIDMSIGIGKPFEIYDRIYLDDYYGVPKEERGATFLPEVIVTGKKRKR